MNQHDWLTSDDVPRMLAYLRDRASEREFRLFAVACCRSLWPLFVRPSYRRAVELAEQYAEGVVDAERLADLRTQLETTPRPAVEVFAYHSFIPNPLNPANPQDLIVQDYGDYGPIYFRNIVEPATLGHSLALGCLAEDGFEAARSTSQGACCSVEDADRNPDASHFLKKPLQAVLGRPPSTLFELQQQARWLRDIVGNPFEPLPTIEGEWLWSNGGTVRSLAQRIYDHRSWGTFPIMADALEDAGCCEPLILNHCRAGGPHVRGCFVLDLLLGYR